MNLKPDNLRITNYAGDEYTLITCLTSQQLFADTIFRTTDKNSVLLIGRNFVYETDGNKSLKYPQPKTDVVFRPHFGYGVTMEGKSISHYGVRILLPSGDNKKYGLEITSFDSKDDNFISAGIVLEQRLLEWFNMSIGTIGYFDYGNNSTNTAGLVSNLGWEPNNHRPFKPFVTYRNDVIFSKPIDVTHLLSIGFTFAFE